MLQLHGNMVTKVARVQYCRVPIREGRRVRLRSLWFAAVGAIRGVVTCMRGCDDSHAVEGFTCGRVPTLHDKLVGILQRGEAYKNVDIRKVFAGGSLDDEGVRRRVSLYMNSNRVSISCRSWERRWYLMHPNGTAHPTR
jgi:hypothetical protein